MRVTLNLASRPYVELRPLYQRLRVTILVLALVAAGIWYVLKSEHAKAAAAQARVDAIQSSVATIQNERTSYESQMRQPANAAILRQAQYLNNVYLHKAFSWTAVMIDLERVLPAGVQVLSIDPQVSKDGHVSVHMRVLGQQDRTVDLIRNLERSRRFLQPRLTAVTSETNSRNAASQPNQQGAPTGVNFDIVADYNPLPIKASENEPSTSAPVPKRHRRRQPKPSSIQAVPGGAR